MPGKYDNAYLRQFRDPIINRMPEYSAHNIRQTKAREEAARFAGRSAGFVERTQTGTTLQDRFKAEPTLSGVPAPPRPPEVMEGSILTRKA